MNGSSRQALAAARAVVDELTARPVGAVRPASDPGQLAEQLAAVSGLLREQPALRRALTDPGAPAGTRAALARRLFGSQVGPGTSWVVEAAVSGRWGRDLDLVVGLSELGVDALLARAEADGGLDEVEDELFRFGRILAQNAPLSLALTDAAAPVASKKALVDRLLAGKAHPVTVRLVELAAADGRGGDLERQLERFSRIAAARRDRVVAVARVAAALDADQVARLQAAVSRYFGREIQLQVDVDPSVLGGVVVRVGDVVVDGTVLRRLAAARRRLLR